MKKFYYTVIVMIFILIPTSLLAHGNEEHTNNEKMSINSPVNEQQTNHSNAISYFGDLFDDLSYSNFPTLHPLVVHVPVVLIPLAFFFAVMAMFLKISLLFRISVAILSLGVLGGFIAAFPLHPHTTNLSQSAMVILSKHDFFAYGTLWLGSIGALVGIIYCYSSLRPMKWVYITLLLLITASVSITGHYGGKMTYIYGIGVQGKYLQDSTKNTH